jgi:hypothetical protein
MKLDGMMIRADYYAAKMGAERIEHRAEGMKHLT